MTRLPPPLELEAMNALWRLGEATVRDVSRELNRRRPLAYTTVLTLLDRLARKGVAGRRKHGRAHIYHPLITREAAQQLAVDRLASELFEGSRERLLALLEAEGFAATEPPTPEPALDAALL